MFRTTLLVCAGCALLAMTFARAASDADPKTAIAQSLDAFHKAAADTDFNGYFARLAPDAVFLGTDASERWTVEQFKTYCKPHFDTGKGWKYTPIEGKRFVTVADDGRTAWFDELLSNAKYGTCRGSGVLRRVGDEWRIAQYNLAFMVPNDVAAEVVAIITANAK